MPSADGAIGRQGRFGAALQQDLEDLGRCPGAGARCRSRVLEGALGRDLPVFEGYPDFRGAALRPDGLGIIIQRIREGAPRLHLDIHTTDLDAEVTRLEALGARRVRQSDDWWIMQDPAGLVFCVIPDGSLNEDNAKRWD